MKSVNSTNVMESGILLLGAHRIQELLLIRNLKWEEMIPVFVEVEKNLKSVVDNLLNGIHRKFIDIDIFRLI